MIKNILEKKYFEYFFILVVFVFLDTVVIRFSSLSENVFHNSSIFLNAFINWKYILLFISIVVSILFCKYFKISWENIDEKNTIRTFIMIVAGVLVWKYAFLDFNYFYNQEFLIDRFLLIALFILVWFNPSFLYALVAFIYVFANQLHHPIIGVSYTDQKPLFDILVLFVSFLVVNVFKKLDIKVFLILAISLHASNYFIPGIAKLELSPHLYEWVIKDNLSNLFVSSYINGWLGFLDKDTIFQIAKIIEAINIPALVFTLLIQVFAIFILFKEKSARLLFIGFEALHIGIFLASGIFFWKWIILNIAFIFLLSKLSNDIKKQLFTKQSFIISAIIIFLSPFYFKPPSLAWYDSKVNNVFEFIVTDEKGNKYHMYRNFFSPYDQIFAQNRFFYTIDKPIITGTFGTIGQDLLPYVDRQFFSIGGGMKKDKIKDYNLYALVEKAKSIDEIKDIDKKYGVNNYDKEKYNNLKRFLKEYFTHYNKNHTKRWFEYLGAFYHIYSYDNSNYHGEKVKKVEVIYKETFYNNYKIEIVEQKKVMEVEL